MSVKKTSGGGGFGEHKRTGTLLKRLVVIDRNVLWNESAAFHYKKQREEEEKRVLLFWDVVVDV